MSRDRKRPYAQRTRACDRTISVRKSAGTKRPRNTSQPTTCSNPELNSPPMNLGPDSTFLDIDTLFDYSAFLRVRDGRPQLAKRYTQ